MNWTKEIPTVDGWYWIWCHGRQYLEWLDKGRTFEYNASCEEYELVGFEQGNGYEFYGPLEEPK